MNFPFFRKWAAFLLLPLSTLFHTEAKHRIIVFLQEGLGHELDRAAKLYSDEETLWDWRYDSNWQVSSLSTLPLVDDREPNQGEPFSKLSYDSLYAWNGSVKQETEETSNLRKTFDGYHWLISNASDARQATSAFSIGQPSFVGASNWHYLPPEDGAPAPYGQHLLEWAHEQGLKTGVVSDMPFTYPTNTILAGAREYEDDEGYERFNQLLQSTHLDLYIATGHPKYNEAGQALSEPKYQFCDPKEWRNLRGHARSLGWEVVFGDENLMGVSSGNNGGHNRRLVILQFGDTSDTSGMQSNTFGLSGNLYSSISFQLKSALSYLDQSEEGFLLVVHLGRLPHFLANEFQFEALQDVLHLYKCLNLTSEWVENNGGWNSTSLLAGSLYEFGLIWGSDSSSFAYSQINDRGKKKVPGMRINHLGSTAALTPLIYRGPSSGSLDDFFEDEDPIYGNYLSLQSLHEWIRKIPSNSKSVIDQSN